MNVDMGKHQLVNQTLYPDRENNGKHKMGCILRTCDTCGVHLLLTELFKAGDLLKQVSWYQWIFVKKGCETNI